VAVMLQVAKVISSSVFSFMDISNSSCVNRPDIDSSCRSTATQDPAAHAQAHRFGRPWADDG
jgi:hypothetical protein